MATKAKRLVMVALAALGLLAGIGLIEGPSGARASWSWGASNSGGAADGVEAGTERGEDPIENRNPDKASPKLLD